jgi:hypothetical protein
MRGNLRAHHARPKYRGLAYDKVAQDFLLEKSGFARKGMKRKVRCEESNKESNERLNYRSSYAWVKRNVEWQGIRSAIRYRWKTQTVSSGNRCGIRSGDVEGSAPLDNTKGRSKTTRLFYRGCERSDGFGPLVQRRATERGRGFRRALFEGQRPELRSRPATRVAQGSRQRRPRNAGSPFGFAETSFSLATFFWRSKRKALSELSVARTYIESVMWRERGRSCANKRFRTM